MRFCGDSIALLRRFDCAVEVVTMSDGALSHPNSKQFPAERLRDLRESEMLAALEILGVGANCVRFLRYRDRSVPNSQSKEFVRAVENFGEILQTVQPATVLLPWRRDPHPSHLASNQIATTARRHSNLKIKFVEYPIWLWELAAGADAPIAADNVRAVRLDVSAVVEVKQKAIAAHRSQISGLIADDSTGFRLTPEILRHFAYDWEIYLEELS